MSYSVTLKSGPYGGIIMQFPVLFAKVPYEEPT